MKCQLSLFVFNTASKPHANLLRRHFMILCGWEARGSLLKTLSLCCAGTTQRLFPNKTGRISYISTSDRGIPIKYFVRRLKTVNRKRSVFALDAYMYGCKKYKKKGTGRGRGGGWRAMLAVWLPFILLKRTSINIRKEKWYFSLPPLKVPVLSLFIVQKWRGYQDT